MAYIGPDFLGDLEEKIVSKRSEIEAWFADKRAHLDMPIYGSVDIRDSNWKVAVIDANQYPAGFNNLNDGDIGMHLRDAIGDILYVVYGTAASFGINADKDYDIIHKSNMTKLCKTEMEAHLTV